MSSGAAEGAAVQFDRPSRDRKPRAQAERGLRKGGFGNGRCPAALPFGAVWSIAEDKGVTLRTAAYIHALGRLAAQQVRRAIAAYRDNDAEAALALREDDARLDAQYTALFRELLTYMMEDPRNITPCTHLLFMAKNLERVGDHATNIAENVWFLVHGEQPLPPREKRDETSSTGQP